ncbi:zinc metalloprotease [Myxococcus qinghaiensis]|uniref:hypothetical protein n=1 Tax=Myxococcus qinghaiensis TaxID=2906758 RepID=UPI0020A7E56C|nr:hypothetical protein [Myxococcus qinghaiensis]MCP3166854.1 hypothetical protein [Myxococcus qinghaiensis]
MDADLLEGIEQRLVVDTSEAHPVYLMVSRKGRYLRLSESTYQLLRQLARGATFEQLANAIRQKTNQPITAGEVEAAYRRVAESIEKIDREADKPVSGHWIRLSLLPAPLVARLASWLSPAFHPAAAAALLMGMLVVKVLVVPRVAFHVAPEAFWMGYLLFLGSLLLHELGHSSACAWFGTRPSDIGFTVYAIYPAFYSDVSSAWRLKRWQRVLVDLGGVYFQLLVGSVYAIAYLFHPWDPLQVALLLIWGSCLFSLNPILKFDGYWVVADALGVTNLAQQPRRLARRMFQRLRGQPVQPLPWPSHILALLAVYSVVSVIFWVYFVSAMLPVAWRYAQHYPVLVTQLATGLRDRATAPVGNLVGHFLASSYMLLLTALMLWRWGHPAFLKLVQLARGRTNSPERAPDAVASVNGQAEMTQEPRGPSAAVQHPL